MPDGYQAPCCKTCGHTLGDHGSTPRSLWADLSRGGRCLCDGCECREFVGSDTGGGREEFERRLVAARSNVRRGRFGRMLESSKEDRDAA